MDRSPILRTSRLGLRPLERSDLARVTGLFQDEDVARYIWDGHTLEEHEVDAILVQNGTLFEREGLGLWGVSGPADTNALIGFSGFWYFHDPPELELLYGFLRPWWGRGFATEAAGAVARYAVERLGLRRVVASADVPNVASHRVLERLGLRFERRALDEGIDTVWYGLEVTEPHAEWTPIEIGSEPTRL